MALEKLSKVKTTRKKGQGMKHISITRKIVSGVAMLALLLTGGLIGQSTSQAAGLPTVRILSPEFKSQNETFQSDQLGQYYAAGGRSFYR